VFDRLAFNIFNQSNCAERYATLCILTKNELSFPITALKKWKQIFERTDKKHYLQRWVLFWCEKLLNLRIKLIFWKPLLRCVDILHIFRFHARATCTLCREWQKFNCI